MSQASDNRSGTTRTKPNQPDEKPPVEGSEESAAPGGEAAPDRPREIGGRKGPEPTRFGDWEKNGRCIDF